MPPDFSPTAIKKAIGGKRWAKIQECDFECGVLDIMFKPGWVHPGYAQTLYVIEPDWHEMTKADVITDLIYFIDDMIYDEDLWDRVVYPNGTKLTH